MPWSCPPGFPTFYNVFYIFIKINDQCSAQKNKSIDSAFCPDISLQIILSTKARIDLNTVLMKRNCHTKYSKCCSRQSRIFKRKCNLSFYLCRENMLKKKFRMFPHQSSGSFYSRMFEKRFPPGQIIFDFLEFPANILQFCPNSFEYISNSVIYSFNKERFLF